MRFVIPVATAAAILSTPVLAQPQQYFASLLGSAEVPAVTTPGFGQALVTIDSGAMTMRVQSSFSGLIGNTTASHIHCCTNPGTNVGVATQQPSFAGFPLGVTSGNYDNTFDMTQASSYNPAFITANGGTVSSAFNVLVAGIDAGRAYFNVHTATFPGGEIRGHLVAAIPEPETYAMLLAGLGLLGFMTRRRKQ